MAWAMASRLIARGNTVVGESAGSLGFQDGAEVEKDDDELSCHGAIIAALWDQALSFFHQQDGAGYQLLADAVIRLNATNPQIASRLLTPLTKWRRLTPELGDNMRGELQRIAASPDLSSDVYEVVTKALA